jgi:hypothetical protein
LQSSQKKIDNIRSQFRILKKWKIAYNKPNEYCAKCVIHPRKGVSIIYGWGRKDREPKDFLMHEVLHSAVRALVRMDKRKSKDLLKAEEEFVQDLCKIIYPKI